jgi:hypothetical protein
LAEILRGSQRPTCPTLWKPIRRDSIRTVSGVVWGAATAGWARMAVSRRARGRKEWAALAAGAALVAAGVEKRG